MGFCGSFYCKQTTLECKYFSIAALLAAVDVLFEFFMIVINVTHKWIFLTYTMRGSHIPKIVLMNQFHLFKRERNRKSAVCSAKHVQFTESRFVFLGMIMWSLFLLQVNAIARWERDSFGCVRRDPLDSNHLGDPNGTNMIGKLLKWSPKSNARKLEMGPLNTQNDHCPIKLWKSHVWLNWLPFNLLNRFMTHLP